MPNIRVYPPVMGQSSHTTPGSNTPLVNPCTTNGRTYSAAPGTFLDVPDFDADVLTSNGWGRVTRVGPTSVRPTASDPWFTVSGAGAIPKGFTFLDTTLGILIVWDGASWRNPATWAAV